MPRLLQVVLALSLLLNAFFIAGFVFRGWIAPLPFEHRAPQPGARPGAVDTVANEVKLDDSQRKALQGMLERYSQIRRERHRDARHPIRRPDENRLYPESESARPRSYRSERVR